MLPSALPFFLKAQPGERFCLYHEPDPAQRPHGAVLYVHPFAEELNRCRRMAALQSRAWAAAGYGVLQIDLYGCGDSSGDFADATLAHWRHDLAMAVQWLRARADGPLLLWGARLGALLALDFAVDAPQAPDAMVLWQPVGDGALHLRQFERVASAARMTAGEPAAVPANPVDGSREIAGYRISAPLYDAIASLNAKALAPRTPVHWIENALSSEDAVGPALPTASNQLIEHWRGNGATVHSYRYSGRPFWTSTEISECPALLDATAALVSQLAPAP
jgi:exosortase A-associated hydrolase 2